MSQTNIIPSPEPKADSPEAPMPGKEPPYSSLGQTQETLYAQPTPITFSPEANIASEAEPYSQGTPFPESISTPIPTEAKPETRPYVGPAIENEQSPSNQIIDQNNKNTNENPLESVTPPYVTQNVPNTPQEKTERIDNTGTQNMEAPITPQTDTPKQVEPSDSPY